MRDRHHGPEEILERARSLVEQSEYAYEQFLEEWGIDRRAVERAARGEHVYGEERRRALEDAIAEIERPAPEPAPLRPARPIAFPPHAVRC